MWQPCATVVGRRQRIRRGLAGHGGVDAHRSWHDKCFARSMDPMSSPTSPPSPSLPPSARPSVLGQGSSGRGLRAIIFLAGLSVFGFGLHAAAPVVLPILFGFLFAAAAQPLVHFLEEKHVPSSIAVLFALLAMLLVLSVAGGTLFFGVVDLIADAPAYSKGLRELQTSIVVFLSRHGLTQLAILVNEQSVVDLLPLVVQSVGGSLYQAVGFATLATLVTFFGLTERDSLLARLPQQGEFEEAWHRVLVDTQRYLGIKTAASVMTGLLGGSLCAALGLPSAALWGAIAFWFNFVPVVGSLLAGIPPVLVALATQSPGVAMAVGSGYFIVNVIIGNILEPRWHGAAAGLSPLVVVVSIAFWGGLMGPLGALIAVPLTMIVKLGCVHTRDLAWVARLLGRSEQGYSILGRRTLPRGTSPRDTLVSRRDSLSDAQART